MPFLLAEILNFQGSTHRIGVGSFSYLVLIQFMIFSMARIYTSLTTRALIFVWVIFFFKRSKTGGITLSREKGSV